MSATSSSKRAVTTVEEGCLAALVLLDQTGDSGSIDAVPESSALRIAPSTFEARREGCYIRLVIGVKRRRVQTDERTRGWSLEPVSAAYVNTASPRAADEQFGHVCADPRAEPSRLSPPLDP